jgi:hypothetical protein
MSKKPPTSKNADKLPVVAESERGSKLHSDNTKHVKAMEFARRSFRKYADTYKALAKKQSWNG